MGNRGDKQHAVSVLKDVFTDSNIVIVSYDNGLKAAEMKDLRKKVKQSSGRYLVVKNTLAKIALKDSNCVKIEHLLSGPASITYSDDPVSITKALTEFSKQNDRLEIKGAVMDGNFLDAAAIKVLASLPPLDVLRAQLIGLCGAAATGIARLLRAPAEQLARVFGAYSEK